MEEDKNKREQAYKKQVEDLTAQLEQQQVKLDTLDYVEEMAKKTDEAAHKAATSSAELDKQI
mgnify:CR=1 FL=1